MSSDARRAPVHNRVVLAMLASRAHRLLPSSIVGLRVTGVRSRRVLTFPVMAAPLGGRFVVYPGHPERKKWWRNVASTTSVGLLVGGAWRAATATVLRPGDPGHEQAAEAYLRRWPRVTRVRSDPLVVIVAGDRH